MDKTYWYRRAKHPMSVVAGLENALHPGMFRYHDCPESWCRLTAPYDTLYFIAMLRYETLFRISVSISLRFGCSHMLHFLPITPPTFQPSYNPVTEQQGDDHRHHEYPND